MTRTILGDCVNVIKNASKQGAGENRIKRQIMALPGRRGGRAVRFAANA
jgi:hypothetical protein